ncbi:transport ATPase [Amycolatopsis mediterranei S699]|uniref:Transport ATPase n=3 Tax=Amycolatopsis mediterranei TaxID=33910 RepID=A0A0H3D2Z1_AMYMU|nr:cation-translocating P-type ATPase [Amycolatopsis mediterranei]ADJ45005.1 transport ATPase [Amycolatopsis mediterranei U32]AEK41757.1 transport ATPase [Amycolatopsis mediterranei S699]AFO76716.1 transport ATPase [Amycolatopsis mediterranei S699]AGT83844.1 transport ATPase [Amycolatopsis mediterranei RB]KDO11171.1 ATPase [Amycolatopsis mediterranei]
MLGALFAVAKTGMTLALAGPLLVTRQAKRAASALGPLAGELAAGAAETAAEATRTSTRTAVRAARVVRNASGPRSAVWRAGRRLHFPLRPHADADRPDGPALAAELAGHDGVAGAYWDGGLGSVVLHLGDEAAAERVAGWIADHCGRHGLTPAEPGDCAPAHPGDTYGVRAAALALAMDVAGLAVSVGTRSGRLHETVRAAVAAAREHPAVRAALDERFGWYTAELARSGVSAAVRGLSQDPLELVLDALLRTGQLTEAIARLTAFDAGHDDLCSPERPSLGVTPQQRRVRIPMEDYARNAVGSGLLAALADLLVRRKPREAAEAFLAASPMPARYAGTAFHTAMGTAFAREGVLVRDPDRLKALDTVDTVVLHADALHGEDGLDPHAEAVLDAARRAEARVVITGDDARDRLGEFASLADDVAAESFFGLVTRLQDEGRVVLTVGRPPARCAPHCDEVAGLLAGDLCVALADRHAPVLWGADLVVRPGLTGVWRVLRAAGAARVNSRRATRVATAGSLIGGLLLMSRRRRTLVPFVPRLDPVLLGGLTGLAMGTLAAVRVAAARPPAGRTRIAWHELTGDEVLRRLADAEPEPTNWELTARRVRAVTGAVARHPAAAPVRFGTGLAADVVAELNDPLTPVLALGAVASAVVGSPVDALLVAAAMGLNAVVGGAQQFRGRRALAKLQDGMRQRARREGGGVVDARALQAGDRIELRVGDVVPADARLLTANDLEADESALTGESLPVAKQLDPVPGAPPAERSCLVFAGTTVVSGEGTAVVVAVGSETVAGRAVELATRTAAAVGIQARLQDLTRRALPLTMLGGALVTGLSAIRGRPLRRALAGGVAIAVAAVPEGLPLVATVAQRAAARRLSARGILVRAPRALEALGRLDVVCFDKTGTLTENRLRVVTTTGPDGEAREPGPEDAVLRAAARACPGTLDDPHVRAHATDHAVLDAAGPDEGWTELAGQPFEANRGYSATIGRDSGGDPTLVVKGAPEIVLPACAGADELARAAEALADKGLRVLAVASRKTRPALDGDDEEVLAGLEFLGFLGLADTLRPTAGPLISGLRAAGVAPVMLTGDHPNTARAIATSLGWPSDAPVVTGDELAALDRAGRARLLSGAGVIARVAPEQKLQVVEALREAGRVTAMVGDGANDAAAIRAADVGIGVRARASTAARTAADVALTGEDLTVLLEAVAEGRALWRSVSDAVVILVGGNAGEIGFSVLGTLLSGDSPLGTRQLLLVNLLTDLFPAMAVAVTRPDDAGSGGLGDGLTRAITSRGVTTGVGATTAWLIGRCTPGTVRRTSTMALCGLVGTQLAQTLRGRRRSPLVVGTAVGSALVLAAIVQTPGVSRFFGCTPLGPLAWAGVGAGVATGALTSSLPILRQP